MSHLTNIVKKEVKELLTPGSIASVLIMVVLFAGLGGLIGDEVSKNTVMPTIGVVNIEDQTIVTENGEWDPYETLKSIYINSGDKRITADNVDHFIIKMSNEDILELMESTGATVVLVFSEDFKDNIEYSLQLQESDVEDKQYLQGVIYQYYMYQPAGMISGTVSSSVANSIVSIMNSRLSNFLMGQEDTDFINYLKYPISGTNTYTFINGEAYADVTPADVSEALTGETLFIPMIIMIIIMMVGSIVISSMGSEKENKTLETLLTLPISRTTIVTGKIIAAAFVGLVFGMAYMLGMGVYIGSITTMAVGSSGVDIASFGLALTLTDYLLIGLSMFLSIACALGICMILGAFAKNYKSAQTMTMPLRHFSMGI